MKRNKDTTPLKIKRSEQINHLLRLGSEGEMAAEKLLRRLHDHATKNGKKLLAEPFHYFDMIDHFVNNDYFNKDEWDLMRVSILSERERASRNMESTVD